MALNSELQSSQGTIGRLKSSMKEVSGCDRSGQEMLNLIYFV